MKYFKNLHAGWADFTVENFNSTISYVRDVVWDVLRAYEEFLVFGHCIIPFDEEGSDFNIYVTDIEIVIVRTDEHCQRQIFTIQENPNEFMHNIALDVADNLEEWCRWNETGGSDLSTINKKVKELELACVRLGICKTKIIEFRGKDNNND